jgi:hypothetical protein
MPNVLDATGLTVDSVTDVINNLTTGMQDIYGSDINVDSNSPDGQWINILAQAITDNAETIVEVYNSFAWESAAGTVLDQRIAFNGLTRKQGTYTTTPVAITVNQALTLYGLDQSVNPVFTVQDNAGNQFYLQTTQTPGSPGTNTYTFRAVNVGQVQVTSNTIQTQVTVVLGVSMVNNPTTSGTIVGVNEETDVQLKIRHAQSFDLAAIGPADTIEAALLAIPDVTDALVVENFTDSVVNGVPAHSIWPIVTAGQPAEIAQVIYSKMLGAGQKGAQTYVITRPNGNPFVAQWDVSLAQPLYIQFTINPITAGQSFDINLIKTELQAALVYKLGQSPTVGDIVKAMLAIQPNSYQTALGVSTDGASYFDVVPPTDAQHFFTLTVANIIINT